MLRGVYEPTERRLIWDAIGFGIAVGQVVPQLFSPRWEEGWERSITDWQDELGIGEVLKTSPFENEFENVYGLQLKYFVFASPAIVCPIKCYVKSICNE